MTTTSKRDFLKRYEFAALSIERLGIAIQQIEQAPSASYTMRVRVIKQLKRDQQRLLIVLDRAAASLGAPYPTITVS